METKLKETVTESSRSKLMHAIVAANVLMAAGAANAATLEANNQGDKMEISFLEEVDSGGLNPAANACCGNTSCSCNGSC